MDESEHRYMRIDDVRMSRVSAEPAGVLAVGRSIGYTVTPGRSINREIIATPLPPRQTSATTPALMCRRPLPRNCSAAALLPRA